MSDAKDKPTGKDLAKRLDAASPAAQADMLMGLLDGGRLGEVLAQREWTASKGSSGHGGSWPTHQNDHRNESTTEGRTP
jgi:hypothetical protein